VLTLPVATPGFTLRRTSVQLSKPFDATLKGNDLWDNPAAVTDLLNLDNSIREELLGYQNNNNSIASHASQVCCALILF